MECEWIEREIELALAAGTPFDAATAEHLATCPTCHTYAAAAAETDARVVAVLRRAEPRPPEGLHDRIMQAVTREALPKRADAPLCGRRRMAAALLLAAAAVVLMALAMRAIHAPSPQGDVARPLLPPQDVALLATVTENFRALDPRHVARERARPFCELALAITATVTSPFRTIPPGRPTGP